MQTERERERVDKLNKQSKRNKLSRSYRNPERSEIRDGGVEDLFAATHDGDGSSMFAELRGDLEPDAGSAAGDESNLAFEYIGLERRVHDHDSRVTTRKS